MTSVLTPTHGINVVLNQRQLRSGVSLVLSVLEIWVCSQRDQCDGSKKQSQHQPCLELWPFNLAISSAQTEQAKAMATIQIQ